MKIKKVVMRKMYQDMKVGFRTSFGVTTRKHFSMIEIHTDDGVGYGDCSAFERPWYNEETRDGAFDIIRKFLVPTLFEFGDVPSPEAFYDATSWIRRNKMARAAVDCALWDLYAQEKGVLRRAGHTEACVDMCRLAGLYPAAALMEIMNDDGTMARLPELREMADKYDIKLISIADLIAYRLKEESIVEKGEEVDMPTQYGHFRLIPFRQKSNGLEHVALIKGDLKGAEPVLVRVHSSCATGDIFGSLRCDCGDQLHKALQMVEKEGRGAVIYLNQEGRGIGLMEKMRAYKLQENGMDTVDANICLGHQADERDYGVGAQILRHLGITKMRLMTNNPVKRVGLEAYGLTVVENIPIEVEPNPYNEFYMKTKKERMGHILHNIK